MCSFKNFQFKHPENNAFSRKMFNTKVSQFRGRRAIIMLTSYLLDISLLLHFKVHFLFSSGKIYFFNRLFYYGKKGETVRNIFFTALPLKKIFDKIEIRILLLFFSINRYLHHCILVQDEDFQTIVQHYCDSCKNM